MLCLVGPYCVTTFAQERHAGSRSASASNDATASESCACTMHVKGHPANARAPRPADHGDRGKRRGREGMAAAAPRNLRCLRAFAVCVQPQPSRQPGERRRHPSGFACRRVCRRTPGSSGRRRTPSCDTKSSMHARTRMAQVREPTSCRRCRNSARSHTPCSRTAAAAALVRQLRRGRPG